MPDSDLPELEAVCLPFDEYPDLVAMIRDQRIRQGFTHASFETKAGLAEGHLTKIENFDKGYGRAIGPVTLPLLLGALNLQLVLVKKTTSQDIDISGENELCLPPSIVRDVKRQMGLTGAQARTKSLSPMRRSEIAKKAAKKRWAKKRKGRKPPNLQS